MSSPAETSPAPFAPAEHLSPWQIFWRRLRRQKVALTGGIILCVLYTLALFAGFVSPYRYDLLDKERSFHPPTRLRLDGIFPAVQRYHKVGEPATYQPVAGEVKRLQFFLSGEEYRLFGLIPSRIHLFGTGDPESPVFLLGADQFGRDILSRVLYGSQISLSIGLIGITLSFSLGMLIGGLSGYIGGMTDTLTMRLCELIISIPGLYLIMALRSVFPASLSSTWVYVLIIVILSFIR